MVSIRMFLSLALGCAAALAARSQPVPGPPPSIAPTAPATPVSVSIATDKKIYGVKDPIKLTLTVKNPTRLPVKLTFNSGQKYDFEIRKGKGRSTERIWQWSRGRMFFQMINYADMEPGKKLTYTETFTPGDKGADGKQIAALEPGVYTASGILALSGRAPRPIALTTFTVR